ncbi:hypothetical protein [Pontimicrobium sp. MEBiC06410]
MVLQDINIENKDDIEFKLKIWFGGDFGGIELDFNSLEINKRTTIGKEVKRNIWEYKYKNTGETIDFYNPFN